MNGCGKGESPPGEELRRPCLVYSQEEALGRSIGELGLVQSEDVDREPRGYPGIAMSGYGLEADIARSLQAGFVEHLVKPVQFPVLQQAIRRVMRGRTGA